METIAFLVDLVQDVGALRDVMLLAREVTDAELLVLKSRRFATLDKLNVWQQELETLCGAAEIKIVEFEDEFSAYRSLVGRRGLLFSASESDVPAHAVCHAVFAAAPTSFLRVTLQHGFECVGFLHNAAHENAYGRRVRFNADIVATWADPIHLSSLGYHEVPKAFVCGPPMALRKWDAAPNESSTEFRALFCENFHSVRLQGAGVQQEYLELVAAFAERMQAGGGAMTVRPHPTGQFASNNPGSFKIPSIEFSTLPIYREQLQRFSFAVSAPSSVLIDLALAGVPVAVWCDSAGHIDTRNYEGLHHVTTLDECWDFAVRALTGKDELITQQRQFLRKSGIPTDVSDRLTNLLNLKTQRDDRFCRFNAAGNLGMLHDGTDTP